MYSYYNFMWPVPVIETCTYVSCKKMNAVITNMVQNKKRAFVHVILVPSVSRIKSVDTGCFHELLPKITYMRVQKDIVSYYNSW